MAIHSIKYSIDSKPYEILNGSRYQSVIVRVGSGQQYESWSRTAGVLRRGTRTLVQSMAASPPSGHSSEVCVACLYEGTELVSQVHKEG